MPRAKTAAGRRAPAAAAKPQSRAKQAAQIDADIDELLEGDVTKDSIMIMRVLPLKKGTSVADRTVKFIAGYTKFIMM